MCAKRPKKTGRWYLLRGRNPTTTRAPKRTMSWAALGFDFKLVSNFFVSQHLDSFLQQCLNWQFDLSFTSSHYLDPTFMPRISTGSLSWLCNHSKQTLTTKLKSLGERLGWVLKVSLWLIIETAYKTCTSPICSLNNSTRSDKSANEVSRQKIVLIFSHLKLRENSIGKTKQKNTAVYS